MIRLGRQEDLDQLYLLARRVVKNLRENRIDQWTDGYPDRDDFEKDIMSNALFIVEYEGVLVGSITVLPENEEFYHEVTWDSDDAYVVHRVMVSPDYHRQGIGTALFEHAIAYAKSNNKKALKVDTHPDNYRMQSLIQSLGFKYCGYIRSINRQGYELLL
ncbi:MAG: GNAT family N-acetyltransferase [Candidatus Izemoplasmatales bacterium]|jgi:GNAT superfamily N-acetyltransferase